MRTRTRTANTTLPGYGRTYVQFNPSSGPHVIGPEAPVVYQSLSETMVDGFEYKRRSGFCKHSKLTTWWAGGPEQFISWSYPPQSYHDWFRGAWIHKLILPVISTGTKDLSPVVTVNSFDWGNASYHALKQMRPSVDQDLLTPNFIAELAEMGIQLRREAGRRISRAERERLRLVKHNEKAAKAASNANYRKKWEKSLLQSLAPDSPVWKRTMGSIGALAKFLAWANLAWQFAIKPTISDAKKIASLLEKWSSMVSELIRKAEKRQVRHYARPVDNLYTLPSTITEALPTFLAQPGTVNNSVTRQSEHMFRPMYHASMLFTYDASSLKGLLGKMSGLISALGANKVASIVWEAIPYSFVVDWFVNVGDMIASIEDQFIDPLPIVIHDFSHSLKYGYRTKLKWNWGPNRIITDIGYRDTQVYERRRDTPSLVDSLSVRLPNLNQAGLGLSLLVMKMDGIPNWRRR